MRDEGNFGKTVGSEMGMKAKGACGGGCMESRF